MPAKRSPELSSHSKIPWSVSVPAQKLIQSINVITVNNSFVITVIKAWILVFRDFNIKQYLETREQSDGGQPQHHRGGDGAARGVHR